MWHVLFKHLLLLFGFKKMNKDTFFYHLTFIS